jgi:hypothetical protein
MEPEKTELQLKTETEDQQTLADLNKSQDVEIEAMYVDEPPPASQSEGKSQQQEQEKKPQESETKTDQDKKTAADDKSKEAEKVPDANKTETGKADTKSEKEPGKADADASTQTAETEKEGEKAQEPVYADPEAVFKVVTPSGAKDVPIKDMATTYQQFESLQRQHLHYKPVFEFVKKEQVPNDLVLPFLLYGYDAYRRDVKEGRVLGQDQAQHPSNQVAGPFQDEKQAKYFEDRDPEMFAIIQNLHKANMDLRGNLERLSSSHTAFRRPSNESRSESEPDAYARQELTSQFNKKVLDWSAEHSDYFKPDKDGNSQSLDAFKLYIANNFPHWRVSELSPERLSIAFSGFDEKYYTSVLHERAKSKEKQLREQDRKTFAETSQTRSAPVKLGEQEQEISDMYAEA